MNDVTIDITLDGETISIDLTDISGVEWRSIKQQIGLTAKKTFEAAQDLDFEALAALVWIVKRRDDPDTAYDEVLSGLSLASFVDEDDEDDDEESEVPSPDAGVSSES